MKRFIYTFSILCFVLFSCQDENQIKEDTGSDNTLNFTLNIPDFRLIKTKASYENTINNLWLLIFDTNGLFIQRVQATNLNVGDGTGSFSAQVPSNTGIIHFIANYDQWSLFDDRSLLQKDEREILPFMSGNSLAFWGRNVITSLSNTINVTLFRNQAKVTVESLAANFQVTGYALANYTTRGTIAPFNPTSTPTPFILVDNVPTIPQGNVDKTSQTTSNCDLTPKYMFENSNLYSDQTYVIIKGKLNSGTELYYKIQLLDANKQPYPIIRNALYRVVINSFNGNAHGATTFDDAKNAEPSNNIYAEILKESPTISDNNNNILTVSSLNFLFIGSGTLTMTANYTKNGVTSNSDITVTKVEDQGQILSNLSYNVNGTLTASVSAVIAGQQQATFVVKAGVLSRVITITSSPAYSFSPATLNPTIYTAKDQNVTLNFNIPSTIPSSLFPIKCYVTTKNLYPIAPNKNLQIEYIGTSYKYVYWATSAGPISLNFKTSLENSDETITIENNYFNTASLLLQARHFTNVSINSNNVVSYGTGKTATFNFRVTDIAGSPASYPLTIKITTSNLTTTQSGWAAVTGGYATTYLSAPSGTQQVSFTSNKNISREDVIISANGFAPTTIRYDNSLAQAVSVTGDIRSVVNGTQYSIPRYSVTSSNTGVVANFTTSNSSTYTFSIKSGSKLSDMVTFSTSSYYGSYTVEQLLAAPVILVQ